MDNMNYCDECGGEIVGIICSICFKKSKITRDIGSTKRYLQEKVCDAKKSNEVDSLFYDKKFIKDLTGIEKFGRKVLCTSINIDYDKIIENGTVKRKVPRSILDIRCHNSRYIYLDKDLRFKKKKIRITKMRISGIEFFVDIGFGDKYKKDYIIVPGFITQKERRKGKIDKKTKIQKKKN